MRGLKLTLVIVAVLLIAGLVASRIIFRKH